MKVFVGAVIAILLLLVILPFSHIPWLSILIFTFEFAFTRPGYIFGLIILLVNFVIGFFLKKAVTYRTAGFMGLLISVSLGFGYWTINLPFVDMDGYSLRQTVLPFYFPKNLFPHGLFPSPTKTEFLAVVMIVAIVCCMIGLALGHFLKRNPKAYLKSLKI